MKNKMNPRGHKESAAAGAQTLASRNFIKCQSFILPRADLLAATAPDCATDAQVTMAGQLIPVLLAFELARARPEPKARAQ